MTRRLRSVGVRVDCILKLAEDARVLCPGHVSLHACRHLAGFLQMLPLQIRQLCFQDSRTQNCHRAKMRSPTPALYPYHQHISPPSSRSLTNADMEASPGKSRQDGASCIMRKKVGWNVAAGSACVVLLFPWQDSQGSQHHPSPTWR